MTNFNFSDIIEWDALSEAERTDILRRPAVMAGDKITAVVSGILDEVESRGDAALRDFSAKFDRTEVKNFKVSKRSTLPFRAFRLNSSKHFKPRPKISKNFTPLKCSRRSLSKPCPASFVSRLLARSAPSAFIFRAARHRSFPQC